MKRKIYLMLLAGGLSCAMLLSACGSDSAGTSADAESSVAAAEADEEDDENTGGESTGETEDGNKDSDSGDSDSGDSDSGDAESDDSKSGDAESDDSDSGDASDNDADTDSDTDEDTDDSDSGSSGSKKTEISDKKIKKQVTAIIEDVSENQASQSLASAGYEPTVSAYEGELMVYLRMPDPVDMPLYAEAICDYILEADDKYTNFSVDHIYLRTFEEADEGYVEDGTLISWATTNGEDGMFLDDTKGVSVSDFTVDLLKAYFDTE